MSRYWIEKCTKMVPRHEFFIDHQHLSHPCMTLIKFTCFFMLACHNNKLGIIVVRETFAIKTRPFFEISLNFTYSPNPHFPVWISVVKLHLMMFNLGILSALIAFFSANTNCKHTETVGKFPFYFPLEHKGRLSLYLQQKNIDFERTHALKLWYCSSLTPYKHFFLSSLNFLFLLIEFYFGFRWILLILWMKNDKFLLSNLPKIFFSNIVLIIQL